MKKDIFKISAEWDYNVSPADEESRRGLLIDIESVEKAISNRAPINLSLVIDRSGSMSGGKIEAAKEAAIGVVECLTDADILSVVTFDSVIETLVDGLQLTTDGKEEAIVSIRRLEPRGCTDLGGGWFEGARCAASVMDAGSHNSGHIVLLSDGMANEGLTDPRELNKHAAELAERGVTTSCVGIGDYSLLQLNALVDGGLGRLHDCDTPEEIVEVLTGELGDLLSVVSKDLDLVIRWPSELNATIVSNFETSTTATSAHIRIGQLLAGSSRKVPVLFEVPALPLDERLIVHLEVSGRDPETGSSQKRATQGTDLRIVSRQEAETTSRNDKVASRIAALWQHAAGFDAIRLNEAGDYVAAQSMVADAQRDLGDFVAGLAMENDVGRNLERARRKVSSHWGGRSKRMAMVSAKKGARMEEDHRSNPQGDWTDEV